MTEVFNPHDSLIIIPVTLTGPKGTVGARLALDTGATVTTLNIKLLLTAGYDPAVSLRRLQMTTGSGVEYVPLVTVESLTALGEVRSQFIVIAHTLPPSATVDGLLGLDFFRDRELTLDFRKGKIKLR